MKDHKLFLSILLLAVSSMLLNACSFSFEVLSTPTSAPTVADIFTSTPQTLESTPAQTELASSDSDRLGLCFSYPQGYTQLPNNRVSAEGKYVKVYPHEGIQTTALLRVLLERGVEIDRFQPASTPLEEIFVKVATQSTREVA